MPLAEVFADGVGGGGEGAGGVGEVVAVFCVDVADVAGDGVVEGVGGNHPALRAPLRRRGI